ncbi:MAG: dephospho-CoA kinase, partial [Candidatus Dormibacteraeota bacterium]|nr:dephospho-CoA kinase [Candidatus Dormibacteraeota bacterium]
TGGIATGKSTVAAMLQRLGATVIDSDLLAREVVEPGRPGYDAVVRRFGEGMLNADGSLDRARLGALVFDDPDARRDLERITHARIAELMQQRIAEAFARDAPVVVVDIPLLYEAKREDMFEGVLLVYAPRDVQMRRMGERNGLSADDAAKRLEAQLPIDEKRERATWVIDNSAGAASTEEQVRRWWAEEISA